MGDTVHVCIMSNHRACVLHVVSAHHELLRNFSLKAFFHLCLHGRLSRRRLTPFRATARWAALRWICCPRRSRSCKLWGARWTCSAGRAPLQRAKSRVGGRCWVVWLGLATLDQHAPLTCHAILPQALAGHAGAAPASPVSPRLYPSDVCKAYVGRVIDHGWPLAGVGRVLAVLRSFQL